MATINPKARQSVATRIREIAELRYPYEACGFIVGAGKKTLVIEKQNEAHNKRAQFLMNPEAWIEAEQEGEILGVWHTHVEEPAQPSPADLAACEESELPWFLMSIHKRSDCFEFSDLIYFEPKGYEQPYVGRPYVYGTFDCWSLVVDYLKRELGISISNSYPRLENFWLKDETNFFDTHFANEGLIEVDGELQKGDVLMFQTDVSGHANHVGVFIGNNQFLHHVQGRLSTIDTYGGYWEKHTIRHLRHVNAS